MSLSSQLGRVLDRTAVAVGDAEFLDPIADVVGAPIAKLPAGTVKDLLSGVVAGHPAHPALVAVPIGAFSGVLALDLAGQPAAARTMVGFGLVGSLPAALAGMSDWSDTRGAERRVGVVHWGLNVVGVGLMAASWFVRRDEQRGSGFSRGAWLSVTGLGVIGAASWLGGHLAYALGVGVDTTAFQKPPTEWTDTVPMAELVDDRPLVVRTGDVSLLLVRRGERVTAIFNRCTHRGGPLGEGPIRNTEKGSTVECPWHGSVFALDDGSVLKGPATRPAAVLETRVTDGRVQVRRRENQALRTNPAP